MTSLRVESSISSPAHYVPEAPLRQHVQTRDFPSRRVRKRPPQADVAEFKAKCIELRRLDHSRSSEPGLVCT